MSDDEQILDELFSEPIEHDGLLADCLIEGDEQPGKPDDGEQAKAERLAKARDLIWGSYP